jgi:hypothetical protein
MKTSLLVPFLFIACATQAVSDEKFPPGWLPLSELDDKPTWSEVREIKDRIHLYLPDEDKPVRGVFACFVFHSGDPRELADLWNFALVTVPWPFEYDLGVNDKRNGRYKIGHASQDMGLLLRYLDHAGKKLNRPELSKVPLVGWLGQNGSRLCADLFERAPERVLAWSDSFPNRLRQYPELTKKIPFPFAWEASKADLRTGTRTYKKDPHPPADLSCRATTYGHGHGIYSKFNFFMFYLDRCIQARMPETMPPLGQPVMLKPALRENGWVGDFDPIGSWNPIAPAKEGKLKEAKYPVWLPDEYAAWSWRAYHSSCTDLKITGPRHPYSKIDGKWGGNGACGLGYGGYLSAKEEHVLSASVKGDYPKVLFHDGNKVLGETTGPAWALPARKLEPGLRVLFAVGVKADGSRAASKPAMVIVK